jgi:hypothetical protein
VKTKYLLIKAYYTQDTQDLEYLELGEIKLGEEVTLVRLQKVLAKLEGNTSIGRLEHAAYRCNLLTWVEANIISSFLFDSKDTKWFGTAPCYLIDKVKDIYKQTYNEEI